MEQHGCWSGGVKSGIARGICRHRLDQLRNLTVELHSSGGDFLQLIRTARKPTGRGHFSDGSNDITKMVRGLNRVSQQRRHVARALRNVKPYVARFVEHVRFRQGEPRWNSNTSTWWRCRIRTRTCPVGGGTAGSWTGSPARNGVIGDRQLPYKMMDDPNASAPSRRWSTSIPGHKQHSGRNLYPSICCRESLRWALPCHELKQISVAEENALKIQLSQRVGSS